MGIHEFDDESRIVRFERVAPPAKAPIQPDAVVLGLLPGLRVEPSWCLCRCSVCHSAIGNGAPLVWVPDFVRPGDSAEVVTEACRQGAYNGESSGWCLSCADALGKPKLRVIVNTSKPLSWLRRLWFRVP